MTSIAGDLFDGAVALVTDAVTEIREGGGEAIGIVADLAEAPESRRLVEEAVAAFRRAGPVLCMAWRCRSMASS